MPRRNNRNTAGDYQRLQAERHDREARSIRRKIALLWEKAPQIDRTISKYQSLKAEVERIGEGLDKEPASLSYFNHCRTTSALKTRYSKELDRDMQCIGNGIRTIQAQVRFQDNKELAGKELKLLYNRWPFLRACLIDRRAILSQHAEFLDRREQELKERKERKEERNAYKDRSTQKSKQRLQP